MAQLTGPLHVGAGHIVDLQAAEFGMQANHRIAGHHDPNVVFREALQQGELPRAIELVDDHRSRHATAQLRCLEAHQRAGAGELQSQGELMGQGFLGLLLQDPQQAALFPQPAALLLVVLKVFPRHIGNGFSQQLQLLAQFSDAALIFRQIKGGQIAAKAALHQLFGLGELVALQQVQHHAVAGRELAHQRIGRAGGELARFPHAFKAALHRDHIALGIQTAAARAAGHLQKLTGHQRPVAVFGALGER